MREHPPRNVLAAICIFPIFVAAGVDAIAEKLRFRFSNLVTTFAIVLVGVCFLNIHFLKNFYWPHPETRLVAKKWLEVNVGQGASLVIAEELKIDRAVDARYSVRRMSIENTAAIQEALNDSKPTYFLVPKLDEAFATPAMRRSLELLAAHPGAKAVRSFFGVNLPARRYYVHFTSPTVVVIKK